MVPSIGAICSIIAKDGKANAIWIRAKFSAALLFH